MKKLLVPIGMLLAFATGIHAQSDRYVKSMEANIILLDSAHSSSDYVAVAAAFERIGDAEKTQWLPFYYAALADVLKGFSDPKTNKDEVADQAEAVLKKAEALEPNNSEIAVIKNMIATLHMLVDPQSRWMQYGAEAGKALATAKTLDPTNPRVYYLEGQSVMGTPAQFGGGKDKAKPLFQKSLELFKTFKPASKLHPTWGAAAAKSMLERCS